MRINMSILEFSKKTVIFFILFFLNQNALADVPLKKIDFKSKFPIIAILDKNGNPFTLKFNNDSNQNRYVINFWATWCLPCKKELPDLNLLSLKLQKYKINVITVSIDKKNTKDQLLFLKNNGASHLSSFFDKKMNLYKSLKLRGIPTTILVNKSGLIVSKHEGVLKWGEDKIVKNILNLIN